MGYFVQSLPEARCLHVFARGIYGRIELGETGYAASVADVNVRLSTQPRFTDTTHDCVRPSLKETPISLSHPQ